MTDNTIDPNETRDFTFNWAPQLATGETIATEVTSIVDRLGVTATNATIAAHTNTDTTVTVRLTGATGSEVYVLCRVTTSTGQILDDTWRLRVTAH